ncbi:MAG: SDR family NAD(P)-dependent oxidoreductase [Paracoccaceae bacterium]
MNAEPTPRRAALANLLEGKIALVTGAGSGIGRASALAMARSGAQVVVLAETAARLHDEGHGANALQLDVTDDDALRGAIDGIARRHGRLDILHSHTGYQVEGDLEQVPVEGMEMSWRLNVRAHFVAARAAVAHMKAQGGGSIIVTASNSSIQYDRGMIAYATTKHAAAAMTRQIAADFGQFNIRVNALCPGFIDTPFNAGFEKQMGGRAALERHIARSIPMGRWGTPEEIADAVLFLASDMSSFMTGHALVVDGGECI